MDRVSKKKSRPRILVVTYWSFSDALIQTYTLPYLKIITKVNPEAKLWLVTQEKDIRKFKLDKDVKEKLELDGIKHIPFRYLPFGFRAALNLVNVICSLLPLIIRNRINYIHIWGTPSGIIGLPLSIVLRKHLVIDSYEPHAESMVENGTWSKKGIAFKVLFRLEKILSKRAMYFVSATSGMRDYAHKKYGVTFKGNFYVKPACVDLSTFSLERRKNQELIDKLSLNNKIVGVYAGKLGGIYLEDEVFDLVKVAIDYWGENFRFLILANLDKNEIERHLTKANIDSAFVIQRFVSHYQIPDYIGLADFGITPVKPVPTKRYCTPIKNGEYWALGLPTLITKDISDDSEIIEGLGIGYVFKELSIKEYAEGIKTIDRLLETNNLNYKIREVANQYRNFSIAEDVYKKIYGEVS